MATGHDARHFAGPGAEALGQPSIDLLRAVITTHLDAVHLAKESLQSTLLLRILEYARAHLAEPGLNAVQVAAAHRMSRPSPLQSDGGRGYLPGGLDTNASP